MAEASPVLIAHRVSSGQKSQVALAFVHGFSGDPEKTWGQFPKLLSEDRRIEDWDLFSIGYATSLIFDVTGIWSAEPNLTILSDLLRTVVSCPPFERYRSLAIVAHSMGGLVVQRALVDDPAFVRRVGHLILFGTPSDGLTKASPFRFWKRQIADMAQGSPFITDLRGRWKERFEPELPFRFLAVAGDEDQFVPPGSSIEPFPFEQRAVVYGNHLQIVKPVQTQDLSVQVVLKMLIGEAAPAGPWSAARVAVESRDFQRAIEELWPHRDELDDRNLVALALALESVGQQDKAIDVLEKRQNKGTDPLGVLGGRFKRRWLATGQAEAAERARELYRQGLAGAEAAGDSHQVYYHAINIAFLDLGRGDREGARQTARLALDHTGKVTPSKWSRATEGEAWLYLEDPDRAITAYQAALAFNPQPRETASMFEQAAQIAEFLDDQTLAARLRGIFRVEG